jgi:ribosomal protein S18 acetylase RimI-like enzyme
MMSNAPGLLLRQVRYADPDVETLVTQVQVEYTARYGGPDDTPLEDGMFDPPRGAFFLGYLEDRPVAMGGWRLRSDLRPFGRATFAAEIKRMYVAPAARRRGLARRVLGHLESTARAAGGQVMVLETGIEQPEAIALYEASGYRLVEKFGHYTWSPKSRCFGKPLSGSPC